MTGCLSIFTKSPSFRWWNCHRTNASYGGGRGGGGDEGGGKERAGPARGGPQPREVLHRGGGKDLDPVHRVRELRDLAVRDPHLAQDVPLLRLLLGHSFRGAEDRKAGAMGGLAREGVVPARRSRNGTDPAFRGRATTGFRGPTATAAGPSPRSTRRFSPGHGRR